eukprot:g13386.t1
MEHASEAADDVDGDTITPRLLDALLSGADSKQLQEDFLAWTISDGPKLLAALGGLRSEPGLRGSASGNFGKYERVVRSNSQQSQLSEEDASANTVIASKEVLAAFATAKARFEGRSEG